MTWKLASVTQGHLLPSSAQDCVAILVALLPEGCLWRSVLPRKDALVHSNFFDKTSWTHHHSRYTHTRILALLSLITQIPTLINTPRANTGSVIISGQDILNRESRLLAYEVPVALSTCRRPRRAAVGLCAVPVAPKYFSTGRFERVTAVEMTAVTATGRHDGAYSLSHKMGGLLVQKLRVGRKTVLEVRLAGNQRRQSARISPSSARTFCTNAFWTLSTPSDPEQTSAQTTTTVSVEHFHPYSMKKLTTSSCRAGPLTLLRSCERLRQRRKRKNDFLQEAVASRPSVTAVLSPVPFRRESLNLDDGTETGRVCPSPNRRNNGRARRRDGAQPYAAAAPSLCALLLPMRACCLHGSVDVRLSDPGDELAVGGAVDVDNPRPRTRRHENGRLRAIRPGDHSGRVYG
ncbi:hypothetical protein C8J57DRAFT_1221017 [Mycena rebaudengoi]|nr:hypothetical protein C8J57DRAFT_1221017 [Mycena rebaudengoi]